MPTGQANRMMPTLRRVVLARQSASRSDGELLGAFVNDRDADAFAELVRRHGPMVLGVCRRVVGDHTTAEDAFQAAFLVLARRAVSVRPREQVGNWLYGVAYRTALKARMVLARRRSREKQVDVMPEPTAPVSTPLVWSDLQPVIDEELEKLPDKLRLPVVLCDLEGRPQREVAKHLNVPPATLATRLASARRTLAQRLTRRGVVLSGGALAGLLGIHASATAVPPLLISTAVHVGEAVATDTPLDSLVSAKAIQISEGVMRMMMLAKLKAVTVVAVAALVLTTGLGLGLVPASANEESAPGAGSNAIAKREPGSRSVEKFIDKSIAEKLKKPGQIDQATDDATFLRRLCLDVRGTPPTDVEEWFFVSDNDDDKRAKVAEWIVDEDQVKVLLAKKFGVPLEKVKGVRMLEKDGKRIVVLIGEADTKQKVTVDLVVKGDKLPQKPDPAHVKTIKVIGTAKTVDAAGRVKTNEEVQDLWVWLDADNPKAKAAVGGPTGQAVTPPRSGFFQLNTAEQPQLFELYKAQTDGNQGTYHYSTVVIVSDSDAEFLKRVLADVRGNGPTALELKYFNEDKDPKKREKLLNELLKEPAVQKKLGEAWKKKMLALGNTKSPPSQDYQYHFLPEGDQVWRVAPATPAKPGTPPKPPAPPTPPTPQKGDTWKIVPAAPQKGIELKIVPDSQNPQKGVEWKVVPGTPATPRLNIEIKGGPKPPAPPKPATPAPKIEFQFVPDGVKPAAPAAVKVGKSEKFEKLVTVLIAAKKSDDAILETLTLATLGRFPTDSEKKLTLPSIANAKDRKSAWVAVARALAGSEEKPASGALEFHFEVEPPAPPAKP